jgi:hypothetical protein
LLASSLAALSIPSEFSCDIWFSCAVIDSAPSLSMTAPGGKYVSENLKYLHTFQDLLFPIP